MALLLGVIILALAVSLAVLWWSQVVLVIQGLIVIVLFKAGVILMLIGYSRKKAEREYSASEYSEKAEPA